MDETEHDTVAHEWFLTSRASSFLDLFTGRLRTLVGYDRQMHISFEQSTGCECPRKHPARRTANGSHSHCSVLSS